MSPPVSESLGLSPPKMCGEPGGARARGPLGLGATGLVPAPVCWGGVKQGGTGTDGQTDSCTDTVERGSVCGDTGTFPLLSAGFGGLPGAPRCPRLPRRGKSPGGITCQSAPATAPEPSAPAAVQGTDGGEFVRRSVPVDPLADAGAPEGNPNPSRCRGSGSG